MSQCTYHYILGNVGYIFFLFTFTYNGQTFTSIKTYILFKLLQPCHIHWGNWYTDINTHVDLTWATIMPKLTTICGVCCAWHHLFTRILLFFFPMQFFLTLGFFCIKSNWGVSDNSKYSILGGSLLSQLTFPAKNLPISYYLCSLFSYLLYLNWLHYLLIDLFQYLCLYKLSIWIIV